MSLNLLHHSSVGLDALRRAARWTSQSSDSLGTAGVRVRAMLNDFLDFRWNITLNWFVHYTTPWLLMRFTGSIPDMSFCNDFWFAVSSPGRSERLTFTFAGKGPWTSPVEPVARIWFQA